MTQLNERRKFGAMVEHDRARPGATPTDLAALFIRPLSRNRRASDLAEELAHWWGSRGRVIPRGRGFPRRLVRVLTGRDIGTWKR